MKRKFAFLCSAFLLLSLCGKAGAQPAPTRTRSSDGRNYAAPRPLGVFPASSYGLSHGSSSFSFAPLSQTDHSGGAFTYYSAPFFPRNSEGVYEMEVWLQKSNGDGSWSEVSGGNAWQYFKVATPNPGPAVAVGSPPSITRTNRATLESEMR